MQQVNGEREIVAEKQPWDQPNSGFIAVLKIPPLTFGKILSSEKFLEFLCKKVL